MDPPASPFSIRKIKLLGELRSSDVFLPNDSGNLRPISDRSARCSPGKHLF